MRASNWIQQADQAMIRAAAHARSVAASTRTPIHFMKDGGIVAIIPEKEARQAAPANGFEESDLPVVREDTPPYGNRKT